MISKLIFSLFFLASLTVFAKTLDQAECNAKIQGGVDVFPWSVAKPFPWSDIQGIWKLSVGDSDIYLKARVTSTTSSRKILNITLIENGNCSQPMAKGTGFVDAAEKNIVRAIVADGVYRYQLKLALFDTRDLNVDSATCGESVLAASIQVLGTTIPKNIFDQFSSYAEDTQNIMLKKVSNDLGSVCKKTSF